MILGKIRSHRVQSGFSLMEVMIAVAIVAIVAAVALPSYRSYVQRGNRTDATYFLSDAAAKQEQYHMDNKTYASAITTLGYASGTSEHGYYTISVRAATVGCPITTCFVLDAAPQGGQATDSCGTMSIASDGARTPATCW